MYSPLIPPAAFPRAQPPQAHGLRDRALARRHLLVSLLRQPRRGGGTRDRRRSDRHRRARGHGDADEVDGNCLGPSGLPGRGGGRARRQVQDLARSKRNLRLRKLRGNCGKGASSWRLDNSPSKSRADGKPTSTLFWAALICGPLQHLDAHRLRPGLALELERLALGRIEVRSLAEAVTLDQSSCFASSFDSIQSISQVKHHQATHPLAIPAGLHALRIDPHNAGGAIAAVDRTVHHDARRTPGLCRYFRNHMKMRGVVSSRPSRHSATPFSIVSRKL